MVSLILLFSAYGVLSFDAKICEYVGESAILHTNRKAEVFNRFNVINYVVYRYVGFTQSIPSIKYHAFRLLVIHLQVPLVTIHRKFVKVVLQLLFRFCNQHEVICIHENVYFLVNGKFGRVINYFK